MKRLSLVAVLMILQATAPLGAQATEHAAPASPSVDSVVAMLRTGGLVIVFRHAHTDRSRMESHDFSLTDRSTQRNLSEQGVSDATQIGRRVKALGIPIAEVLASPMFRTLESAQHAFGRADTTELLRSRGSSPDARALLTGAVELGQNRVLVTHNAFLHRYLEPLGVRQIGEGDAVVVRPLGDRFEVVGRIRVADWE